MNAYPATLYSHNEALSTFKKLGTIDDGRDDAAWRSRVRTGNLENLRSFVAFEIHYADGRREEVARGMSR